MWSLAPNDGQFSPAHISLLPDGNVIAWDVRHHGQHGDTTDTYIWDPVTDPSASNALHRQVDSNLFCSGHAFLPDGRLVATGGGFPVGHFHRQVRIFDWQNYTWSNGPDMEDIRWYPTLTTLASGEMLVTSGVRADGSPNDTPEVLTNGSWRQLGSLSARRWAGANSPWDRWYPWIFAAPNGQAYYAGSAEAADGWPNGGSGYLDTNGSGWWTDTLGHPTHRTYGSAVMYEAGKILITGGGSGPGANGSCGHPEIYTANNAEKVDLNSAPNPSWQYVDNLAYGRLWHNSTMLADGRVLISGGHSDFPLPGEIVNPEAPIYFQIQGTRSPAVIRGYHSVAILLPDARVMVGGTHEPSDQSCRQKNVEFYSPPYLYNPDSSFATRPTISSAPSTAGYNQNIQVYTPDVANITKVSLIRIGSVTHGFDQNQRFNALTFTKDAGNGLLNVVTPVNANYAPPGHYMLFILKNGTPSMAKFIKIS